MIIQKADRLGEVSAYYFSTKLQQIRQMEFQGVQVINLGIGNPDLPPAPEVIQELQLVAQSSDVHGYQSYRGLPELREAIGQFYTEKFHVKLDAENEILPLIGSKEGIFHISMAFLNPGDTVMLPNPGYPAYTAVSKLFDANLDYYELKDTVGWRINFDQLSKKDLSKVKLFWTNYLHMPTGTNADLEEFQRLVELAQKHKFLIVNDNPYSLILNRELKSILQVAGAREVALELNSISKAHNMAGWRVGWVAGAADYLNTILQVKSNMDSGMFKGIQKAAITALNLGDSWYNSLNSKYMERRVYAIRIAQALKCTFQESQSGMFLWAKIPDEIHSAQVLCEQLLESCHVFITPGFIFGSQGERYIRISLCNSVKKFQEALQLIQQKF